MILVLSVDEKILADLEDELGSGCTNVTPTYSMNEVTELSFEFPCVNSKYIYLKEGNYINYNSECFEIKTVSPSQNSSSSRKLTVSCKHFSDSLRQKYIVEQSLDPYDARTQMTSVLTGTGWTVGTTITESIYRGFEFDEQTVYEALVTIAETFNAYLDFSAKFINGVLTLTVNLYDRSSETPTQSITVNGVMQDISISRNTTDLITRMYCFGGTNPSTGLDVDIIDATVNGQPWGLTYIENYDYYLNQGYSSEYIVSHPEKFRKEYIWRDSNYVDPDTFFTDAVKKLEKMAFPTITISFTNLAVDANHIPEFGSPVNIIDEDYNTTYICQYTKVEHNESEPYKYNVEVSNIIPYGNIYTKLTKSSNTVKTITNADGSLKDSSIRETSITTSKIANGSVTDDKITTVSATKIVTGTLDATKINVINLDADSLSAGSIDAASAVIANGAITTAKIADAAITNAKIDRASVDKLVVTSADIADGTITNAKIDRASIDKLVVDTADIKTGAITTALIGNEAVDTAQIADASITDAKIVELTANKITSGTLSTERLVIRDPSDPSKSLVYSINNVSGALQSIQGETINGEVITDKTITADKIVAHSITSDEIASHSITANEIAAGAIAVGSAVIANGAITTAMIGDAQITTAKIGELSANNIKAGTLKSINDNIKFMLDEGRFIIGEHELKIEADGSLSFTSEVPSDVYDYQFKKATADKCDAEIDGTFHTTGAFSWGDCKAERRDDEDNAGANSGIDFVF